MKKKTFINKITPLLCALLVLVGAFANPVDVRADIDYKFCIPLDVVRMYKYYTLAEWKEGEMRLIVSNEPLEYNDSGTSLRFGGDNWWNSYWTTDGFTWTDGTGTGSSGDAAWLGMLGASGYPWDVYVENGETVMLTELGYLQNIKFESAPLDDDIVYKFSFSSKSTTDTSLGTGAYRVRVYGKLAYYDTTTGVLAKEGENSVIVGDYVISDNSISLNLQDVWDAVATVSELEDSATLTQLNWARSDTIFLQIYNANTHNYGGYVRFNNTSYATGKEDTVVTINPDGSINEDGYSGAADGSQGSSSSGSSGDSSGSGSIDIPDIEMSGFDSFNEVLDSMTSSLDSVTSAFSTIFGFLPPWCLALFGLSVSAMLLIALVKFIRG